MTPQRELYERFLADDGATANDCETERLYRKAHNLPEDAETDLEAVEKWAHATLNAILRSENTRRAKEYWRATT